MMTQHATKSIGPRGLRPLKLKTRMMLALSLLALLQTALIGSYAWMQLKSSLSEQIALRALQVAKTVAGMPEIMTAIERRDTATLRPLSLKLAEDVGALFIVIGDRNGIRLAHPTVARLGQPMHDDEGDTNEVALVYGKPYTQLAEGSLGPSVRGKAPVFDQTGENVVGIVSVGYDLSSVTAIIQRYQHTLIIVIVLVFAASLIFAGWIASLFKRAIFGLEPEQIARRFEEQSATLQTIREGLIAINAEGRITTFNQSAVTMLNLDAEQSLVGRLIAEVLPESSMLKLMDSGEPEYDREVPFRGRIFVVNRIPLTNGSNITGVVSSFRPKDELDYVSERLTRMEQYADSLRAQSHEYTNKLHTIAGLIQIGAYEKAQAVIGQESTQHQELIDLLLAAVPDPILSGCLLGKYNRARELGQQLVIHPESHMSDIPVEIAREHLVTIVGNLIDNAMDANQKVQGKEVKVSMSDLGDELIFEVEDQGPGVEEKRMDDIFKKGVTSKQEQGHGYGLHLVQSLVRQLKGQITVEPGESSGSRFTVYLPRE